jgi:hypothetical protein
MADMTSGRDLSGENLKTKALERDINSRLTHQGHDFEDRERNQESVWLPSYTEFSTFTKEMKAPIYGHIGISSWQSVHKGNVWCTA